MPRTRTVQFRRGAVAICEPFSPDRVDIWLLEVDGLLSIAAAPSIPRMHARRRGDGDVIARNHLGGEPLLRECKVDGDGPLELGVCHWCDGSGVVECEIGMAPCERGCARPAVLDADIARSSAANAATWDGVLDIELGRLALVERMRVIVVAMAEVARRHVVARNSSRFARVADTARELERDRTPRSGQAARRDVTRSGLPRAGNAAADPAPSGGPHG